MLAIVSFVIILLVAISLLILFGGDAGKQMECAIGLFQATGCPTQVT